MWLAEMLVAFFVALVLAVLLSISMGWRGPSQKRYWPAMLFFFLILFFTSWAGGLWITPMGPQVLGVQWVPYIVIGFFVALLIFALMPPPTRQLIDAEKAAELNRKNWDIEEYEQKHKSPASGYTLAIGFFYFVFLLLIGVAILAHYLIAR